MVDAEALKAFDFIVVGVRVPPGPLLDILNEKMRKDIIKKVFEVIDYRNSLPVINHNHQYDEKYFSSLNNILDSLYNLKINDIVLARKQFYDIRFNQEFKNKVFLDFENGGQLDFIDDGAFICFIVHYMMKYKEIKIPSNNVPSFRKFFENYKSIIE